MQIIHNKIQIHLTVKKLWKSYNALKEQILDISRRCYLLKEGASDCPVSPKLKRQISDSYRQCDELNNRLQHFGTYLATKQYEDAAYLIGYIAKDLKKLTDMTAELPKMINIELQNVIETN